MRWIRLLFSPPPPPSINVLFVRGWFFGHDSGLKAAGDSLAAFFFFFTRKIQTCINHYVVHVSSWQKNGEKMSGSSSSPFFPWHFFLSSRCHRRRSRFVGIRHPFFGAAAAVCAAAAESCAAQEASYVARISCTYTRNKGGGGRVYPPNPPRIKSAFSPFLSLFLDSSILLKEKPSSHFMFLTVSVLYCETVSPQKKS